MNKWIFLGCIFGIIAICVGAFGAHSLKEKISPYHLSIVEKGVQYQFYHCLPLLFSAYLLTLKKSKFFSLACLFFSLGILLFSGSLYLLGIREIMDLRINFLLGPLTPVGGICFILGWLFMLLGFYNKHKTV